MKELSITNDIIVYCAAAYGEKICSGLIALGYSVVGFCDNSEKLKESYILGIPVYGYLECRKKFPDAVYVIANSNYSTALEIGKLLENDKYEKNVTYYISCELEYQGVISDDSYKSGVIEILSGKTLILCGDLFLCNKFLEWSKYHLKDTKTDICSSEENVRSYVEKYPDAIWIPVEILIPEYRNEGVLMCMLWKNHINSFSRLFMSYPVYCEQEYLFEKSNLITTEDHAGWQELEIIVKKVMFLKTSSYSGSIFINSVLYAHPQILYLGYSEWGMHIWYIVNVLADTCKEKMAKGIVGWIRKYEGDVEWLEEYEQILEQYFKRKESFTQKDIFMNIHLAHYELLHGEPPKSKELIVYMDIHYYMILRDCMFLWLEGMGFEVILLEMIRNSYVRLGSIMRYILGVVNQGKGKISNVQLLSLIPTFTGEELDVSERKYPIIRLRFEDVKLFPI